MDQVHTPEPPQRPTTPLAQELPHLVVGEPKRSPAAIGGIIALALMVLAIPVGLFLVQQRTQLAPQAAVVEPAPELSAGIILESKLSPESRGGIIPVDVYIKSLNDPVNLASVKLKFDPAFLAVEKIATSAAQIQETEVFNKWVETSFDNKQGAAAIIAGLPAPGIKTSDHSGGKVYLATINLRPKSPGTTVLQITQDSRLLKNSDNQNIFQSGSDLVLNLTSAVAEPSPATSVRPSATQPAIVITSPAAVLNYSYFKPVEIIWSSFNVEVIAQVNLYLNGVFFGPISQNLDPKTGKFTWKPQDSLALPYIQLANTYMIEIVGIGKNGEAVRGMTGPFGIIGQEEVAGSAPNPEVFQVNSLTIDDVSRLLSNYLILPAQDKALDFNRDEVINELDFYLLKQNLVNRGVIK